MKFRLRKSNSWLRNKSTINQIFVLTMLSSFALSSPLRSDAATFTISKEHKDVLWQNSLSLLVTGNVVDSKGIPLPGVSVSEKGTKNGIITDSNGNFKLEVTNSSSILVFRFVGYISQEVTVGNQTNFSITLAEDVRSLNEVVVVGYGTQKKRDLTGSITSVSGKDIANQPVPDAGQAIEGKAAGVQVITSGAPGANSSIQIRGLGSINDSSPLLVIDGVPTPAGINYLNTINPNDIAAIDVLKDASAAAIYGSQGANGVILVTTKKGTPGQGHLNADVFAGVQSVAKKIDLLNASQFALLNNEELTNANKSTNPAYANPSSLGTGTNWLNAILRNAPIQSYSLSYSGGTEKGDYYVSGALLDQQGVVIDSKYRRYNAQFNSNQRVLSWLKTGNTLTLSHDEKPSGGGTVSGALASNPVLPVYNADGSYSGPVGQSQWYGSQTNPVGLYNLVKNNTNGYNIIGSVYGEATIIPGLTFRTTPGLTATFYDTRTWAPENNLQPSPQTQSYLDESYNKSITYNWDNYLTYDKRFGKDHHLTVLAGTSAEANTFNTINGNISGFASDLTQQLNNGSVQPNIGGTSNQWSLFSLMGRVNYSYKDRYLLTATVRRDGSSRFGENKKYGTFPSASLAWRVSEEPFFKNLTFFDDLKIRAGYGTTGNQNGIGNYSFASGLTSAVYAFNGNVVPIELAQSAANPNLSWETIKSTNIGIDATFLHQRINLTVDGYIKNTTGMLVPYTLPISTGYTVSPPINAGKVQNKGIEITVNSRNLVGAFTWSSNFNISLNRNKILSLDQNAQLFPQGSSIGLNGYLAINRVGYPINSFYGYVTQGLFQTSYDVTAHAAQAGAAPGDIRFKDLNNDGLINDQDRAIIGNPNPKFIYGLNNTFAYKGVDLSIVLQGTYGNDIFNANNLLLESMSGANNQITAVLSRWEGPGTSNTVPRAVFGDPNGNSQNSNRYIEDGSYLRIRNVTLGYTLPKALAQRIKFSAIRLYVAGQNLYTFTIYAGVDPEVGLTGIYNNVYPVVRTISFGVNLSL
ncbi:MAG: TonB-linked outer membrane protein SusC/RagA family [Mucilaginibacter sp.]|nr:TonB-linked outer membrane protein SusC/RagA family [Mucilaginibacter sp.]